MWTDTSPSAHLHPASAAGLALLSVAQLLLCLLRLLRLLLPAGRLVFREGALVSALRSGAWVVLDELNLAPTEVLEALNRCACDALFVRLKCAALHACICVCMCAVLYLLPVLLYAGADDMSQPSDTSCARA
jgi:AAA domain (dynein-related subfamily)